MKVLVLRAVAVVGRVGRVVVVAGVVKGVVEGMV